MASHSKQSAMLSASYSCLQASDFFYISDSFSPAHVRISTVYLWMFFWTGELLWRVLFCNSAIPTFKTNLANVRNRAQKTKDCSLKPYQDRLYKPISIIHNHTNHQFMLKYNHLFYFILPWSPYSVALLLPCWIKPKRLNGTTACMFKNYSIHRHCV